MTSVLIVEDSDGIRSMLSSWFAGEGFQTVVASTSGEALSILQQDEKVDVVVTDLMMPGGDGGAVVMACERIGVPVLVLTALTRADLRAPWAKTVRLLTKPAHPDLILEEARSLIRERT